MTREEQLSNGFVNMMKGFWKNQDLEVPNLETLKSKMTSEKRTTGNQEPCDDAISRQAAIDAAIEATDSWDGGCNIGRQKRIENYINRLPSAQPEQHWIPCSERLPDEYDNYLVTKITRKAELEKGYKPHIWLCVEPYTQKSHWGKSTCGVIAWMPLPEPYKAESEDKDGN